MPSPPRKCARPSCIALAVRGARFCAVHRGWAGVDRVLGLVAPLVPITDRLVRDDDGQVVRFYPRTRP